MKKHILISLSFIAILSACNTKINNDMAKNKERISQDSLLIDSLLNTDAIKFELALRLETTDCEKAKEQYLEISKTDSTSYWAKQAETRVRYLTALATKTEFIKKIAGTWNWTWKGTSWGDIETPKKGTLERQLIINENGEIEFYENGKLILADIYEIKSPNNNMDNLFLIELKTSKEIFSLWHHKNRLTLSEPNCVCGCLTNEYVKM